MPPSPDQAPDLDVAVIGAGFAGVAMAQTGSIGTTGPSSTNNINGTETSVMTVTNSNSAHVSNNNTQGASSGEAEVEDNTTGGNATSGGASNGNSTTIP